MTNENVRLKEEVAGIIKSVLVANKNATTIGVTISQLENDYIEQDGKRIPFRALGYPCLLDLLESLQRSNELTIVKRASKHVIYPCVNEKIAHVSALVSGQKDSSKRQSRVKRPHSRFFPKVMYQPPRLCSKMLADVVKLVKNAPNGIHINKVMEYLKDRSISNVDKHDLLRQLHDVSHEISIDTETIYPIMKREPISSRGIRSNGFAAEKSSTGIRPAGLSDSDDDDDYNFEFKSVAKNNHRESPKNNATNNIRDKSKPVESTFDENANNCRRDNENHDVTDENDDDDIAILVNDRTRFRLEKLIQKYPNGIWCADLPSFYQKEYCIPLNYEDLGFVSVSDFAAHLPEIFHCVQLREKDDFKLFNAKAPMPEARQSARPAHLSLAALHNVYESYYDEVEAVPTTMKSSTTKRLVPEGVMTIGETVAQIFVTELFSEERQYIDVVVVDVVTPSLFWIQLFKKTVKFYRFMVELHDFYTVNAKKYEIPIVLLERGLNCACIYDKKWHRGVIKTVKPDNSVTVMFYDYGTVMSYPPQNIHFLHRSFSSLPAQAIPCGLYNVKPKDTAKWPKSVCQQFINRVLDVPLVAMLGKIDADNNSMLITLTDTAEETDFYIDDWMISSGLAMHGKMGETVDMNEKCDDSLVTTGKSDEVSVAHQYSLLLSLLGLHPGASSGGLSGPPLRTIPEESSNLTDPSIPNMLAYNAALITPLLENYLIQQAKPRVEAMLDSMFKDGIAKRLSNASDSLLDFDILRSELTDLENSFNGLSLNDQNRQRGVNSEPPPIPPLPTTSRFKSSVYVRDNVNVGANIVKENDNMNFAKNPFKHSEELLERSGESFFERLDAKSNNRETNPFKLDMKNNEFHANNWFSAASSQSSNGSLNNPFLLESNETFEKENVPATSNSRVSVDIKTSKVPPSTPPRARSLTVKSKIRTNPLQEPTADSHGTLNPITRYIGLEWHQAVDNATLFRDFLARNQESSEETGLQDIAAGGTLAEEIEEEWPLRDRTVNGRNGNCMRETELRRTVEPHTSGLGFTEIHLTKQSVYVFHIDNECWLTIEEIISAFTNYKITDVVLKILDIQNANIRYRFIHRTNYPTLFDSLDRSPLAVPRNRSNKIGDVLQLAPMRSLIKILRKLMIVDIKQIEAATKTKVFPSSSSALFDAYTIITICGNLRQGSQS